MRPLRSSTQRLHRRRSRLSSAVSLLCATCFLLTISSLISPAAFAQETIAPPSPMQGHIGIGYATVSNTLPVPAPDSQRRAPHRLIRKPAVATITAPATAPSDSVTPSLPVIIPAEGTASTKQAPEQGTSASASVSGSIVQTNSALLSPTAPSTPVATPQSGSSPTAITSRTASLGSSRVTATASGSTSATSSGSRSLQRLIAEMPGMSQMVSTSSDPPASPAPLLTLSTSSLSVTATQGADPANQSLTVTSNGSWTASDNVSWLSLSTTFGSNNGTITVSIKTANMAIGNHAGTITVIGGGITRTASVMLSLNTSATPSVTLTWNANTESDLAGYKVYRATTSGSYGEPIATLQGNITSYVVTGLQSGTTYVFVVTAYDTAGNESPYSSEVSRSIF